MANTPDTQAKQAAFLRLLFGSDTELVDVHFQGGPLDGDTQRMSKDSITNDLVCFFRHGDRVYGYELIGYDEYSLWSYTGEAVVEEGPART